MPLGVAAAASQTHLAISSEIYGSGIITLASLNKDIDNTMKTIRSLKDAYLLIKRDSEAVKNELKAAKRRISRYFSCYIRCWFIITCFNK